MKPEKINKADRLFVLAASDGGFSCLGFDVLDRKARGLAVELREEWSERKGTKKAFAAYNRLVEKARAENEKTGRRFSSELSPQLIGLEGKRVEAVTTYGETRRFNVGKSTGLIPCHLEISRRGSFGGPAAEKEYKSVTVIRD